ncbi:FAD binding domain-containing protein [Pseudonocardia sp. H11422]|uniref:FAD binding domain-containing protein n=1 Tax=Pseudonocardia sp. H11422 TaxID=2835866 RepID=UPI001BDD8169|nr:xanthine dehydrogenase family protein subunit M [Pseudonocardia sp. H11422]
MKPSRFSYAAPTSVEEAVSLLAEYGDDAKVIAGGQSLLPIMNMRLATPRLLVDINQIPGQDQILTNGGIRIGALVRQSAAERSTDLLTAAPIFGPALRYVGHAGIRTRGTVCGSLAHADPAAELPAVMLALGATIEATGKGGVRNIPAEEFFAGFLTTSLGSDELVTGVKIPLPSRNARSAFLEMARRHGDFALVGVAAVVEVEGGTVTAARIALSGVADRPVLANEAARILVGSDPTDVKVLEEVGQAAAATLSPPTDVHGSGQYRAQVASVLVRRAIAAAILGERGQA